MLRQASSRNQRAKGFRVKHFLQIFLLVAVCIWLLYQVKHSHDKKKAFEERNYKVSGKVVESEPDSYRFGRKDLPHTIETDSVSETRNGEEGKEEIEEEEEPKQEETEDDEGRGIIDDQIDEQDQFGGNEEAEQGEELADEESEGKEVNPDILDEEDHERNDQEAREENYRRDDAASAVHRDTQTTESEFGDVGLMSSDEEHIDNLLKKPEEVGNTLNTTIDESKVDDAVRSQIDDAKDNVLSGQNETISNDNPSITETIIRESVEESSSNSTTVKSNYLPELQSNMATVSDSHTDLQTNSTMSMPEDPKEPQVNSSVVEAINGGEKSQNETDTLVSGQGQNSTANAEQAGAGEENANTKIAVMEKGEKVDTTAVQEGTTEISMMASANNEKGKEVETI